MSAGGVKPPFGRALSANRVAQGRVGAVGRVQVKPSKRAKSESCEHTPTPCANTNAARCASKT